MEILRQKRCGTIAIILLLCILPIFVASQECSATNPCSTGCCSKLGYCGTGAEFCSPENCIHGCISAEADIECDQNKLCQTGCCSKYNVCGLGPDYCAPENCLSTCDRKSECDPGHFGDKYAQKSKCPLNVCCSKFGFCGTTKDFCGDKKVKRPSCSDKKHLSRVVGYYEGWSVLRRCNDIWPEMIPLGVYTEINFAFATIDPVTFEIKPASPDDVKLYERLVALKDEDPDLRINIAVGGWAFNDPGPTQTTFSDLVRSESNQRKFFKSLVSFLTTYGFDGIDVDWEYPVADDRSGREEDFENFPKFMNNLKRALQSTGGRDTLTLTLPASFWYLQHFDIGKLQKAVDYFNIMSYDLHGVWDKGNKWTGEFLNAHTNLTEIELALDLLWRNKIDPEKVVLGLGFYGRAFTVESTSCTRPGCRFVSASNAGRCSSEAGILLNSEIDYIIEKKSIRPSLYKKEAVQVLSWDDQWVAYDDRETFQIKTDFARLHCLGGVMVWAISHDTATGKYSKALSDVAKRPYGSRKQKTGENGEAEIEIVEYRRQCRWTGCGQACPSGFAAAARSDPGYRGKELMLDETGCDGKGVHTFCCPVNRLVRCGWYTHNNGRCKSSCPFGMTEVGSNHMYCNNGDYQAACCKVDNLSTELYSTSGWSTYPNCDQGECPGTQTEKGKTLAKSMTGSGAAMCNKRDPWGDFWDEHNVQERKLCYDDKKKDKTWDTCAWTAGSCDPTCPSDKVRLAMDQRKGNCAYDGGAEAFCCNDNFFIVKKYDNPEIQQFRDALERFLSYPMCPRFPFPTDMLRNPNNNNSSASQAIFAEKDNYLIIIAVLTRVFKSTTVYTPLDHELIKIWDDRVTRDYKNLEISNINEFLAENSRSSREQGPSQIASSVACNLDTYNDRLSDKPVMSCAFDNCQFKPDQCKDEDSNFLQTNGSRSSINGSPLAARRYSYTVTCHDTGETISRTLTSQDYPSVGELLVSEAFTEHSLRTWTYQNEEDCPNGAVVQIPSPPNEDNYVTEHIVELQTIKHFIEAANRGVLPSGLHFPTKLDCHIFKEKFLTNEGLLGVPATFEGGFNSSVPNDRLFDALGGFQNEQNFHLLLQDINSAKGRLWSLQNTINPGEMEELMRTNPERAIREMKEVIAVFSYLNQPSVRESMNTLANRVREQWELIQNAYNTSSGANIRITWFWDRYIRDLLQTITNNSWTFLTTAVEYMERYWTDPQRNQVEAEIVLEMLVVIMQQVNTEVYIETEGLTPQEPDSED
ncbi:hypothetical protein FQN57_005148 [Myotisia sp. PD_48]|nr:hypothetical protein FQN57_005148 [Myotisia sp. PD_48]